jgi:uncharacterized protein YukJ
MFSIRSLIAAALSLSFTLVSPTLWAEQSKAFSDYVVHYNAFSTDMLQPAIAKQYSIKRSKNRAMFNISVQKKIMGTTGQPVVAEITGQATNLNGQIKTMQPRKIVEDTAIYYIGEFSVTHREVLDFDFNITPAGEKNPFHLKFRQQFFTE